MTENISPTLTSAMGSGGGHIPIIQAYSLREDAKANNFSATPLKVTPALQALRPSVQSHHAQTFIATNHIVHGTQDPCTSDIAFALGRNNGQENAFVQDLSVRRLTPVECERLQGFPDNFTNIPWRGKDESPDGIRYKALGNSMAVPVMQWIGKRIDQYEKGLL
jgi:site-specific DNA-cytosine methylase